MYENEVVEEGSEPKPDHHQHKCWSCDTVWEHPNLCNGDQTAHECPNCKTIQAFHYNPEKDKVKAREWPSRESELLFFG